MTYPDLYASWAFALVDHQVAHVFVRRAPGASAPEPTLLAKVRAVLAAVPGVATILDAAEFGHLNAGDLVLVAAEGAWFAYPWWEEAQEAPDYATHVDIHSKIGFDPCELFWGWPPPSVSRDPARVGGTHGRAEPPVAFASTVALPEFDGNLTTLGSALRLLCEQTDTNPMGDPPAQPGRHPKFDICGNRTMRTRLASPESLEVRKAIPLGLPLTFAGTGRPP
jgi:hypothetical protein